MTTSIILMMLLWIVPGHTHTDVIVFHEPLYLICHLFSNDCSYYPTLPKEEVQTTLNDCLFVYEAMSDCSLQTDITTFYDLANQVEKCFRHYSLKSDSIVPQITVQTFSKCYYHFLPIPIVLIERLEVLEKIEEWWMLFERHISVLVPIEKSNSTTG